MTVLLHRQEDRADAARRLAHELQEAFTQQPLPVVSNLGFSATDLPATVETQIGGDSYDAFEMPDGRIMFSIGDVAGHGVQAAVIMIKVRQAVIAAALHHSDPGSILTRANNALTFPENKFATAICGHVDAATLHVSYATAGHPPGILIAADGSARLLEYAGAPLGVESKAAYQTFEFRAEPNSMLVLYTFPINSPTICSTTCTACSNCARPATCILIAVRTLVSSRSSSRVSARQHIVVIFPSEPKS